MSSVVAQGWMWFGEKGSRTPGAQMVPPLTEISWQENSVPRTLLEKAFSGRSLPSFFLNWMRQCARWKCSSDSWRKSEDQMHQFQPFAKIFNTVTPHSYFSTGSLFHSQWTPISCEWFYIYIIKAKLERSLSLGCLLFSSRLRNSLCCLSVGADGVEVSAWPLVDPSLL